MTATSTRRWSRSRSRRVRRQQLVAQALIWALLVAGTAAGLLLACMALWLVWP